MVAAADTQENYDIIIIGSGMGALSTASLMAQLYDKRVLVLERHYVIGGFTHTFKRPDRSPNATKGSKYEWDVGIHYIGRMADDEAPRRLFDFVTRSQVRWKRMPDPFDVFHYPGLDFHQHGDRKRYRDDLVAAFPAEEANIDGMFADLKKIRDWSNRRMGAGIVPAPLSWFVRLRNHFGRDLALQTAEAYLSKRFRDPKLRALVVSQWGAYGLPPSKSSMWVAAIILDHYLDGGYYPEGGAGSIARSIMPIVEEKGGKFLARHEVRSIIVENGRARGVEVQTKARGETVTKRFYAPVVVSNAGAYNTYKKLLPPEIGGQRAQELEAFLAPITGVTVYLGLKGDARSLGVKGENHWVFREFDHELNADTEGTLKGEPKLAYISFPSLKDPHAQSHTAEIMSFTVAEDFDTWKDTRWARRGEDYNALKKTIADGLIDLAETKIPGFRDLIDYVEVSTPLTTQHYTSHPKGQIYSLAKTPERLRYLPTSARTDVKGLYIAGADTFSFGVVPTLLSGLIVAGAIQGPWGFFKVIRDMKKYKARMQQAEGNVAATEASV